MHLCRFGLIGLLAAASFAAQAQNTPLDVGSSETVLRLAETATVLVHPDEISASLRAEAVAATAAEGQSRVNAAIAAAIARAKVAHGVTVATGSYNVWHVPPTPQDRTDRWQASQALDLKSQDVAILLSLVGELQRAGLIIGRLSWGLSPEVAAKARSEATRQALTALQGRAEEAAGLIGLTFDRFREIRLDNVRPQPMQPRMMGVQMGVASAPPNAESDDMPVAATAEADVLLKRR